jgi:hypothetical protein
MSNFRAFGFHRLDFSKTVLRVLANQHSPLSDAAQLVVGFAAGPAVSLERGEAMHPRGALCEYAAAIEGVPGARSQLTASDARAIR